MFISANDNAGSALYASAEGQLIVQVTSLYSEGLADARPSLVHDFT